METTISFPATFLFLIIMLVLARVGALVERLKQPAVLGELLAGMLLSGMVFLPGFKMIQLFKHNDLIKNIAEIGAIMLLFRAGLESNIKDILKVGGRAFLVATVGVILPFIGGYFFSKWMLPQSSPQTWIFVGATLTATSVGITARVFQDLNILQSKEARIVLGAAVIDDVMGLLILAVVSALATGVAVTFGGITWLGIKALIFLFGSILIGYFAAPHLGRWFSKIHSGLEMKMAVAMLFCASFAYGGWKLAGLATIVGAFAAGLVLDEVHFKNFDTGVERRIEQLVDGISRFFVPIFFVYTGLQIEWRSLFQSNAFFYGGLICVVAFIGKVLSGLVAGKGVNKLIIGVGMIPRGEVGIIFATMGREMKVLDDELFAALILVIMISTIFVPSYLTRLIRKN